MDHLRDLMGHQEWADAVFFHIWSKAEETWDDEEMRRRTEHNLFVQEGFRNVILESLPAIGVRALRRPIWN